MGREVVRPVIFDGWRSWIHLVAAAASVILGIPIPATLVFIAYQLFEPEKIPNKLGDFIEWGIGLFIGAIIAKIVIRCT